MHFYGARRCLEEESDETETPVLDVKVLANAPPALRRRALRQWLSEARGSARRLEMVHLRGCRKAFRGKCWRAKWRSCQTAGESDAGETGWSLSLKTIEKAAVKLYSQRPALAVPP